MRAMSRWPRAHPRLVWRSHGYEDTHPEGESWAETGVETEREVRFRGDLTGQIDPDHRRRGQRVGEFRGVFIRNRSKVFLYAYADNDGNNGAGFSGLNFTNNGPPSAADFVISEAVEIDLSDGDVEDPSGPNAAAGPAAVAPIPTLGGISQIGDELFILFTAALWTVLA